MRHLTKEELESGLEEIQRSPKDKGILNLIVRRPETEQREALEEGALDIAKGLEGDNWSTRGSNSTADGSADPEMQLNIMNSRVTALVAQDPERWSLAGDQLYIDMDLSAENLPPGIRLSIGSAIIEVTSPPHSGCKKFVARFGLEAMKFVNSGIGKQLNLRGINAKVIQSGTVRTGDTVEKI
jgi:MOSC domain